MERLVFFAERALDIFFAAFTFLARAARALTRFWASLARASGESGLRFLATFFVVLAPTELVGLPAKRPRAGRTSVTLPPTSTAAA